MLWEVVGGRKCFALVATSGSCGAWIVQLEVWWIGE